MPSTRSLRSAADFVIVSIEVWRRAAPFLSTMLRTQKNKGKERHLTIPVRLPPDPFHRRTLTALAMGCQSPSEHASSGSVGSLARNRRPAPSWSAGEVRRRLSLPRHLGVCACGASRHPVGPARRLPSPCRTRRQPHPSDPSRPSRPLAWIPLAILWFGVGDISAIFLIFPRLLLSLASHLHQCRPRHPLDVPRRWAQLRVCGPCRSSRVSSIPPLFHS